MSLRDPKKIHENEEFAIFKGSDGHELKILKKGLTEKLIKDLEALPLYQPEGGEVTKGSDSSDYTSLPDNAMTEKPQDAVVSEASDRSGDNPPENSSLSEPIPNEEANSPNNNASQQEIYQKNQGSIPPQEPSIEPAVSAKKLTEPQETLGNQFMGDVQNYHADKANNLIPKTYSDLLFKDETGKEKGFLGKLGAIFGLMVSGAGSGLAHQDNLLLKMMDTEIKNDLEAQKQNQTNKLDYAKVLDRHIETMAQSSKSSYDIWHLALQDEVTKDVLKQAYARRDVLDKFYKEQVLTRKEGSPERARAEQAFANMVNASNKEDVSAGALINGRAALFREQGIFGGPGSSFGASRSGGSQTGEDTGIDNKKWNQLKARASQKLPFSPPESDLKAIENESVNVAEARQIRKVYIDSFNKLNKMTLAGQIPFGPDSQRRQAFVNALGAKLATLTSHRYNRAEAEAQAEGMFPSWKDLGGMDSKTRQIKFEEGLKAIDSLESGTPVMDFYGLKTPRPYPKLEQSKKEKGGNTPKDGTQITTKSGKKAEWRNGKLIYIQ